ncbi:hypothetical protein GNIT_1130 [Glaciecola nitratireducens FR1064]|uniref:Uncharacterized protein n=1 Tax=Glaciecola nitratireducens (strain JCM 12485 / KCTC 12276 / FR1064) TaxID=1085623 RepID=G4QG95_GLANF|nr:hypothetical protein GNIT_1130 [Glaciecola nitratireducens FR1064]
MSISGSLNKTFSYLSYNLMEFVFCLANLMLKRILHIFQLVVSVMR